MVLEAVVLTYGWDIQEARYNPREKSLWKVPTKGPLHNPSQVIKPIWAHIYLHKQQIILV
jgi:fructose-specific phosphotransferase system component IIB